MKLSRPILSSVDTELTSLCQSVLEDFNLCLFYSPSLPNMGAANDDEEECESGYSFLPDLLIFRMVVVCLMSVHSLKRAGNVGAAVAVVPTDGTFAFPTYSVLTSPPLSFAGSKQYSAAIAFTLALFSHLINHVNIRLQAELEDGENPVPAFRNDGTGEGRESGSVWQPFGYWTLDLLGGIYLAVLANPHLLRSLKTFFQPTA